MTFNIRVLFKLNETSSISSRFHDSKRKSIFSKSSGDAILENCRKQAPLTLPYATLMLTGEDLVRSEFSICHITKL